MYSNRNLQSSSSSSSAAASRKQHNERNQQILKALLKEPCNKNCADCKTATHPRWASWNLGCFICIRCSGIHRSMGTHISRVKSVDLDSWTDEQIKNIVTWGNAKANYYWEDGLPANYTPEDSKIENFIRTKYEKKKWIKSKSIPDPSTISIPGSGSGSTKQQQQQETIVPPPSVPAKDKFKENTGRENSLLDFDFGSSTSSVNSNASTAPVSLTNSNVATQSLPNLQHSLLSSGKSRTFGGTGTPQQYQQPQQQQSQASSPSAAAAAAAAPAGNAKPDLKKSILSLYSTPTSSTPNFYSQRSTPTQGFHSIVQSTAAQNQPSYSQQVPQQQQQIPQQPQQQQAYNPWASSTTTNNNTSSMNQSGSKNGGLDDDLFKNVWS